MQNVLIVLVVLAIVLLAKGVKVVRQSQVMLVERLGKYHRTLAPGINVVWPIVDQSRPITWIDGSGGKLSRGMSVMRMSARIDMRETVVDFPQQHVITRDNVVIEINGLLFAQITDPLRATYEVANLPLAIEKLAQTTLRNIIGELDLDHTLSSRDEINEKMRGVLDDATDKWGVKVNRVELQDISPPPEIQHAMEKQMKAERDRRAIMLEAEGEKQARILKAEGIRDSRIAEAEGQKQQLTLHAEGEANAIRKVTEALANARVEPAQYLVAMEYLKMMRDVASSETGQKTVFMPFEAANVLGSVGSVKELLSSLGSGEGPRLTPMS